MNGICRIGLFLFCAMCGLCGIVHAQNVSNVTATQVGKTIHVTYDLDKAADISLFVSMDGGGTYSELHRVSGDVGKTVGPGHKLIVWDVLSEVEKLESDNIVFKVRVDANYENKELMPQPTATTAICGTSTVKDYDGNTYNTVQIGNQCWMRENMCTKHYADGTVIPSGGSSTSITAPYYYDYSGSGIPLSKRGYLYNWPAAMHGAASSTTNPSHVQGICPNGWHLPSDAEWTQLTNYVSSQSEYTCGGNSNYIAKALASETGWHVSSNNCGMGNDLSANNATDFSAVPAGYCFGLSFGSAGNRAYFWSATQSAIYPNAAYYRYLYYNNVSVVRCDRGKNTGYSVRCLRD